MRNGGWNTLSRSARTCLETVEVFLTATARACFPALIPLGVFVIGAPFWVVKKGLVRIPAMRRGSWAGAHEDDLPR